MSKEADEIIALYRRHARAWTDRRGTAVREKKWLDRFIGLLPENPTVLDIGCGSGEPIGRHLLEQCCMLTGIDSSPELINIARDSNADATWVLSDMRNLHLHTKFNGLIAWNSTFHLTPDDQRNMFAVFKLHAANDAVLMFTSGPSHGEAIGAFEGEALYHASLNADEYRSLLHEHGFELLDHVVDDPQCGSSTVWLAQLRAKE